MPIKKIHYCWFGGNQKPEIVQKCINSWKEKCPNYEIVEWNENNFDINSCDYVREAYNAKKWAFVSDYCRFWVLYNYGGIYLDTDVELIKSIDNLPDAFVGFENQTTVASGLIRGALPNDEICRLMLESYRIDHFLEKDGSYNTKTVCVRETSIFKDFGLVLNGSLQVVCKTTVYPIDYFCPLDYTNGKMVITENTYSIHHYSASWHGAKEKYAINIKRKLNKFMPNKISSIIGTSIAIIKFDGIRCFFRWVFKKR